MGNPLVEDMNDLPQSVIRTLIARLEALCTKYETTFAEVDGEIAETETALRGLIGELTGNAFDMQGLAELKSCWEANSMAEHVGKPKVRFAGFTEVWEQRKLGEIADIVGGGTPSTSNPSYWNGDIDWYAPAEIGEQIFLTGSQKKITANGLQKMFGGSSTCRHRFVHLSRRYWKYCDFGKSKPRPIRGFQSIVPDFKIADSYFIFSRTHEVKKFAEIVGAGSTFTEVSGKQMSRMPILMPKLDEQARIGTFFRHLDRLITLHQRKRERLENIKRRCLKNVPQKMEPMCRRFVSPDLRKLGEQSVRQYTWDDFPKEVGIQRLIWYQMESRLSCMVSYIPIINLLFQKLIRTYWRKRILF